jgi:phosphopantothenoylcysteine decarboxylase / phosphopantothenate---cysteine ligase
VELGLWADAMVVAPATATTLSKMAAGNCDNIITATYLSARCPVFVAPAMDLDMWKHPATLRNLDLLRGDGVQIIPVGHGELASGLVGDGRMAEPEDIWHFVQNALSQSKTQNSKLKTAHTEGGDFANHQSLITNPESPLKGKKILVTAGPTYEAIDPVRFIGNRSSGKMGFAIAEELADLGAAVMLISGPSKLNIDHPSVKLVRVESAQQMHDAAVAAFSECDAGILSAAVADYRPKEVAHEKIKKKDDNLTIELVKTPDIAAALGVQKRTDQVLVGFALETNNEFDNAVGKLKRKNFDFIVLNSLRDAGAGFSHDTNKISIIFDENRVQHFDLKSKDAVAKDIVATLIEVLG